MRQPYVGAIVIYRPDRRLPEFHDKGHGIELPAVVVKVWDNGLVNLRVADADLRVLLDSSVNPPYVFGAKYSEEKAQDTWGWPAEEAK